MSIFDVFTPYHDHRCSFMGVWPVLRQDNIAIKSLSLSTGMYRPGLNRSFIIGWMTLGESVDFIFSYADEISY